MPDIVRIPDTDTAMIAQFVAQRISSALDASEGDVAICVPGGSTPFPIFKELAGMPLEWSRVAIWPGDDRIVGEDHPASNIGKIRALFEPVGAAIVALEEGAVPPHFALCWLGMGADGHIASLFPNTNPQVDDEVPLRRLTPDPLPPEAPFDRITLTIPSLLNSAAIMFTLGGADEKRMVFDAGAASEHDLPVARLLAAASQQVTCFS